MLKLRKTYCTCRFRLPRVLWDLRFSRLWQKVFFTQTCSPELTMFHLHSFTEKFSDYTSYYHHCIHYATNTSCGHNQRHQYLMETSGKRSINVRSGTIRIAQEHPPNVPLTTIIHQIFACCLEMLRGCWICSPKHYLNVWCYKTRN